MLHRGTAVSSTELGGLLPRRLLRFGAAGLLAGCAWGLAGVPAGAEPHHPVNFSFFYPISTNQDPAISTNFRLSLLYGRVGAVRGVDLGGVVARTDQDFHGLELAGAVSYVGGEMRGAAYTGGLSYARGDVRGVQAAGFINFDRGGLWGFQYASLFNYVEKGFAGFQLSGMYNLNNGDGRYLQVGSFMNVNAGNFTGAQLTGGFNVANGLLRGVQIGFSSFADSLQGVQVGFANFSRHAHGTQIGFLNSARRLDGLPIGAVNLVREGGEAGWIALGSSLAAFSVGARTGYRGFYSMLTAGFGDVKEEQSDTVFLGWHYGYTWDLGSRWDLSGDLGYEHILPQPNDDPEVNDRLHYVVQARALAGLRVSKSIRLFGGPGMSMIFSEYTTKASTDVDPLVVVGLSYE
jgi:hypothetical protein